MDQLKKTVKLDQVTVVKEINARLHNFCGQKIAQAKDYDESYQQMWEMIDEYVMTGGKRIRPYLTMLAYQAYGGTDLDQAYAVACAWELLHAGLLVHDDIIDRDDLRHGSLNISGMYQKKYSQATSEAIHFANSSALLAGDLLLAGAQDIVLGSELSAEQKVQMCQYLAEAIFCVGGGELLDVETILAPIASASPEKIARYKTSSYSFQYPLVSGAFLAGAPAAELELQWEFGASVGIAFQFIDDILGVFGEVGKTGKPNDSDIREKKRTAVITTALANLTEHDAARLEEIFENSNELTKSQVNEVHVLLDKAGAKDVVREQAASFATAAMGTVEKLSVGDQYKRELKGLADRMLVRLA